MYRQRTTSHGATFYTPRLVLFDTKGSLGAVSVRDSLPEHEGGNAQPVTSWDGRQESHRTEPVRRSAFIRELESEDSTPPLQTQNVELSSLENAAHALNSRGAVTFFTDFLQGELPSRSIHLVEGLWREAPDVQNWSGGGGWLSHTDQREEAADRVRALAEESDALGGFQCFVDDISAWGGIADEVLEDVRDDFGPNRPIALFAIRPSGPATSQDSLPEMRRRLLCRGLSTASLTDFSDLFVCVSAPQNPVALSALRWQPGNLFQETALCAAALDSATLSYRLHTEGPASENVVGGLELGALTSLIGSRYNNPLGALSMAFPCPPIPIDPQQYLQDLDERVAHIDNHEADRLKRATFISSSLANFSGMDLQAADGRFAECIVLRGARAGKVPASVSDAASALDAALLEESTRCVQQRVVSGQPMEIPLPFPNLFRQGIVTKHGDVDVNSGYNGRVSSSPVLTRLAGTTAFGPVINELAVTWRRIATSTQGQATLESWGVDEGQREDVFEKLQQLAHAYEEE